MSNTMPPFSMGGWCPRSCVGMSIAVLIDFSLNRITNMGGGRGLFLLIMYVVIDHMLCLGPGLTGQVRGHTNAWG